MMVKKAKRMAKSASVIKERNKNMEQDFFMAQNILESFFSEKKKEQKKQKHIIF